MSVGAKTINSILVESRVAFGSIISSGGLRPMKKGAANKKKPREPGLSQMRETASALVEVEDAAYPPSSSAYVTSSDVTRSDVTNRRHSRAVLPPLLTNLTPQRAA
jgi:hypothetical protein